MLGRSKKSQNISPRTEDIGVDLGIKIILTVSSGIVNGRPKKTVNKVKKIDFYKFIEAVTQIVFKENKFNITASAGYGI